MTLLYPQYRNPGAGESLGRSEWSLLGVVPFLLHGQAHVLCACIPVPLCQGGVLPLLHTAKQSAEPNNPSCAVHAAKHRQALVGHPCC